MVGNEDIKVGDKLVCISNEGLSSIGTILIVKGITKESINVNGASTAWESRKNFRWTCYRHKPQI